MQFSDNRRVVVVDGYSSGRELARELKALGAQCFHLCSAEDPPAAMASRFDPGPFALDLGYCGEPSHVAKLLSLLAPHHVVAGSELGVTYAEQLAHLLGRPTNLFGRANARRNKYEMIRAVQEQGLLCASQSVVSNEVEAVGWAQRLNRWPVVVKPLDGAASDHVTICHDVEDVRQACARALLRENILGIVNERLLVQSYLEGPQFIVNTVSRDGRHFVTDAWRMHVRLQPGYSIVTEDNELLDPDSDIASKLIDYTFKAISALGIVNGAAHSELKWTANGPALIETGARPMGLPMERASYDKAGLKTQCGYYALDLVRPDIMNGIRARRDRFEKRSNLTEVLFLFDRPGEICSVDGLSRLQQLPSFHAHYGALRVGERVTKTTNSLGKGGTIYLVHDDQQQIQRDKEAIRRWETDGALYKIADESEIEIEPLLA